MGLAEEKKLVRDALKRRRAGMGAEARAWASGALCGAVIGSQWFAQARRLAGFVGVRDEPQTHGILQAAMATGKELWLPRVHSSSPPALRWHRVTGFDALVRGSFGLLEPSGDTDGEADLGGRVDLILVPGLGFGSDGSRIGYGKGHYDAALTLAGDATTMGICFAEFLDPTEGPIPMTETDHRVDLVATDAGITRTDG